jgi:hypothetical protein
MHGFPVLRHGLYFLDTARSREREAGLFARSNPRPSLVDRASRVELDNLAEITALYSSVKL